MNRANKGALSTTDHAQFQRPRHRLVQPHHRPDCRPVRAARSEVVKSHVRDLNDVIRDERSAFGGPGTQRLASGPSLWHNSPHCDTIREKQRGQRSSPMLTPAWSTSRPPMGGRARTGRASPARSAAASKNEADINLNSSLESYSVGTYRLVVNHIMDGVYVTRLTLQWQDILQKSKAFLG